MLRLQVLAIRRALLLVDNWDEARYNAVVASDGAEGATLTIKRLGNSSSVLGQPRVVVIRKVVVLVHRLVKKALPDFMSSIFFNRSFN